MWFASALIGYALLAAVFILDKRILTAELKHPVVYTFYSTVFLLAVGAAWLVVPFITDPSLLALSLMSGLAFGGALWLMFIALKKSEASHLDPFIGAVITLGTLAGADLWLNEQLTTRHIIGCTVLAAASFLLAREETASRRGWHVGYVWGIVSGILFAISHLTAKAVYNAADFWPAFVMTRVTIGVFGLCLLAAPAVWRSFAVKKPAQTKHHPLAIVVLTKVLSLFANSAIQYAIALGSVAIVNALAGLQYALMFVGILVLNAWRPKFFREYVSRREFWLESAALGLVIVGVFLVS